ncbi:MAG: PIG-L family deacetylase [Thermaurantimonas sp.]
MYIHRFLLISFFITLSGRAQYFTNKYSSEILHEIEKLQNTTRVLYVAAHPDDENTRLITWLANSRKATVAYLSLTRGEGGQNLIGPELGDALGIIRTNELVKAREIDGGIQFFTRARDFGYSKSMEESLELWNEDSILKDVVTIIRRFKPDVIINRFPPDKRAGHGHHAASAHLALRAFDLAADPEYAPESAVLFGVWQPLRLFWNTSVWWIKDLDTNQIGIGKLLKVTTGDYYPYLGSETGELAAYSRSQHKSQGFGIPATRGPITEYLQLEKGKPAFKDIFDDIETGYARWRCPELDRQARAIALTFNHDKPNASIFKLNEFKKAINSCVPEPFRTDIQKKIDELIWQCSGIYAEITAEKVKFVADEYTILKVHVLNRIGEMVFVRQVSTPDTTLTVNRLIQPRTSLSLSVGYTMKNGLSQPFWLRNVLPYLYDSPPEQIGLTADEPISIEIVFDVEGAEIKRKIPVTFRYNDRVKGEIVEHVREVPHLTAVADAPVLYRIFEDTFSIRVTLHSHAVSDTLNVWVDAPENIQIPKNKFTFNHLKADQQINVQLRGSLSENGEGEIKFYQVTEKDSLNLLSHQYIEYEHIGKHLFFKPLAIRIVRVKNNRVKPLKIGYIPGTGDGLDELLRNTGFAVSAIDPERLHTVLLKDYDVIICGIRAYNTSDALANMHHRLLEYVEEGGTYIILYQTSGSDLKVRNLGPYPFSIGRGRIADESADPIVQQPAHKVLNHPFRIHKGDLTGWNQEIGLYFAEDVDTRYEMPLAWADPGEQPQSGGLLIANYGKGTFIYTGLSFFRQLPAGHSGAFKLFINLLHTNQ